MGKRKKDAGKIQTNESYSFLRIHFFPRGRQFGRPASRRPGENWSATPHESNQTEPVSSQAAGSSRSRSSRSMVDGWFWLPTQQMRVDWNIRRARKVYLVQYVSTVTRYLYHERGRVGLGLLSTF